MSSGNDGGLDALLEEVGVGTRSEDKRGPGMWWRCGWAVVEVWLGCGGGVLGEGLELRIT